MTRAETLTDRADVLFSEHVNGEVRVNIGSAVDGKGFGASVAMWGIPGFISMPDPPDANGACEVLYLVDGPRKYVIAGRDNRFAGKTGAPQPGDRMITANCDARVMVKKADNGVTLYTANEKDDGSTMLINMSGKNGEINILNGGSVFRMTKDEFVVNAGGCTLQLKGGTISVFGKHTALNTGGGNLGVLGLIPPPQGLGSVLAGPTGITGAPSTRWTVAIALALVFNLVSLIWSMRSA